MGHLDDPHAQSPRRTHGRRRLHERQRHVHGLDGLQHETLLHAGDLIERLAAVLVGSEVLVPVDERGRVQSTSWDRGGRRYVAYSSALAVPAGVTTETMSLQAFRDLAASPNVGEVDPGLSLVGFDPDVVFPNPKTIPLRLGSVRLRPFNKISAGSWAELLPALLDGTSTTGVVALQGRSSSLCFALLFTDASSTSKARLGERLERIAHPAIFLPGHGELPDRLRNALAASDDPLVREVSQW
jgi:hypothetical protein